MPRYRLKHGHKHYHMGQKYEGAPPGKKGDFPDVVELDEDQASRIANKLIPLDGVKEFVPPKEHQRTEKEKEAETKLEQETPETPSSVLAGADKGEKSPEDSEKDKESPDSDSELDPPADESPTLSLKYLGDGKWNVMKGDKPVNDVPLDEASAKALVEGGK